VSTPAGSRSADPWQLVAEQQSARVDDQLLGIIGRLWPVAERIRSLVDDGTCTATLQVVRRFNDPEGEEERLDTVSAELGKLEKLPGQHQLLGWHIGQEVIDFVSATGAEIDLDEYG